jgi:hypothetical protein
VKDRIHLSPPDENKGRDPHLIDPPKVAARKGTVDLKEPMLGEGKEQGLVIPSHKNGICWFHQPDAIYALTLTKVEDPYLLPRLLMGPIPSPVDENVKKTVRMGCNQLPAPGPEALFGKGESTDKSWRRLARIHLVDPALVGYEIEAATQLSDVFKDRIYVGVEDRGAPV